MIYHSAVLLALLSVLATMAALAAVPTRASADTCLSSNVLEDASGKIIGSCQYTGSTAATVASNPPGNGGIFSCNAPAGRSIGSTAALGGTFVPVADAAVELNTGILVYESCILKPLFNQEKQAATLAYVNQEYNQLSSGNSGNPYWPVNYAADQQKVADQAVTAAYNGGLFKEVNPAIQSQVQSSVLRNYYAETRQPQSALACPYDGLQSALSGQTDDVFGALDAFVAYPSCNPYIAYTTGQNLVDAGISASENEWLNRLNWSNGIYDVKDSNGNVVVPGIFLNAVGTQALTSGFRQLENANDIGQMVGQYFTGIGSYLLSGPQSVASVQQYIGQAVQQQQNSLASSVVGTALTNLYQIINWEQQYNSLQEQMAGTISTAITQLRGAEAKCWDLITQSVCSGAASSTSAGTQCTSASGATLTVATSTAFSDAVISASNFATLAQTLASRIDVSNQNLSTLTSIENAVQSSDSATRNTGLEQLNTIVNANPPALHVQSNITQAQNELQQLQAAISDQNSGLVITTINTWAGNDSQGNAGTVGWNGDPSSDAGWCNVPVSAGGTLSSAQQQTITNWTTAWTK